MALAGADASLFERYPAEGTPKLTVYREAQRASYLDLPVKTHDPWSPGGTPYQDTCRVGRIALDIRSPAGKPVLVSRGTLSFG